MKQVATLMAAGSLLAAFALAQPGKPSYTITDLGPVGKTPGTAFAVSGNGLVAGAAATPDRTAMHTVCWYKGQTFDLGKAGVRLPNSVVIGVNNRGQVVEQADATNAYGMIPTSSAGRSARVCRDPSGPTARR